jgi:hypothetical protein
MCATAAERAARDRAASSSYSRACGLNIVKYEVVYDLRLNSGSYTQQILLHAR